MVGRAAHFRLGEQVAQILGERIHCGIGPLKRRSHQSDSHHHDYKPFLHATLALT